MTDLDELKRLAKTLSSPSWKAEEESTEAEFIAAANPAAILELIERLERAERKE